MPPDHIRNSYFLIMKEAKHRPIGRKVRDGLVTSREERRYRGI